MSKKQATKPAPSANDATSKTGPDAAAGAEAAPQTKPDAAYVEPEAEAAAPGLERSDLRPFGGPRMGAPRGGGPERGPARNGGPVATDRMVQPGAAPMLTTGNVAGNRLAEGKSGLTGLLGGPARSEKE